MSADSVAGQPVAVRPAAPDDCAAIAALHGVSFPQAWDAASFAQFLADPACITLVAASRGGLEGFIVARRGGQEADIVTLAVAPHERRRGIGRLLVATMADALRERGVHALFLEVGEENAAAASLYRRTGFQEAGRRPGYYAAQAGRGAQDALVMRMDLA